ncbi:MAG: hypothetical protein IIB57_09410, partial [Planctomycetes bacterium]|nr:hypothetical protein [Planctomycetota bacterium]
VARFLVDLESEIQREGMLPAYTLGNLNDVRLGQCERTLMPTQITHDDNEQNQTDRSDGQ